MSRISLVIADSEEVYARRLSDFLAYKYSNRFQVSYFTKYDCLMDFIKNGDKKVDVLLVDKDMYTEDMPWDKVGTVMLLASATQTASGKEMGCINKYQHGDRLVGDIMEHLNYESQVYSGHIFASESRGTRIVSFFSPAGGSGATCVAMGSSVQCAMRGMTVLYLDFQTLSCTELFFKPSRAKGLSDILYSLKNDKTNLTARIEAVRSIDHEHNVHFFAPAESGMELNEAAPEEYAAFIRQIRNMGQYDAVFIDLSADFALRNAAVLEESDFVFLVMREDTLCIKKAEMLLCEMSILSQKKGIDLKDKTNIIINKAMENSEGKAFDFNTAGKAEVFTLPFSNAISDIKNLKPLTNMEDGFNRGINQFLNKRVFG